MPYSGMSDFIASLEKHEELHRIKTFVDPLLEIAEVTDRISKSGGKALLFENNGTGFPVLINAFGSERRMAMALGCESLDRIAQEILILFRDITEVNERRRKLISLLPGFMKISGFLPSRSGSLGKCQDVIIKDPDLNTLPVLKCWPHDGGRFITLPMVHTVHPSDGRSNVGMYRMQVLDSKTTAMHWQRHKTGAGHYEAWKQTGKKMPVSVTLGGDPVCTYAATAPLPEDINEYILAGFLRRKKIKLVRCITNDICVPSDADIVIEGFVDPSEELVMEGPFGDHTGFYSLADLYPRFHVTCITHSKNAVYPATVVGIPPMEDAWFSKATEKIFLAPLKLVMQPEIDDFHMPDAGVAHNLVIVKIRKSYPGQGKKVISALFGAGQMMFTKYLVVVSGEINIRDYKILLPHVIENTHFRSDLLFISGPLDVLDHSSDTYSYGGKLGIDATIKMKEEHANPGPVISDANLQCLEILRKRLEKIAGNQILFLKEAGVIIAGIDSLRDPSVPERLRAAVKDSDVGIFLRLLLAVDHSVDISDFNSVVWQLTGNSDPLRDIEFVLDNVICIDGTIKAFRRGGFPRRWPNIVCSSEETIESVDNRWDSLGTGPFIYSPSLKYAGLCRYGNDEVNRTND